ncbi:MAG: addiction module protein [Planctomycetota bacterium]
MNINETLSQLTSLPVADRLKLVTSLWDSIGDDVPSEMSPDQQSEVDRRVAAHEANPDDLLTWDQVLDQLRNEE